MLVRPPDRQHVAITGSRPNVASRFRSAQPTAPQQDGPRRSACLDAASGERTVRVTDRGRPGQDQTKCWRTAVTWVEWMLGFVLLSFYITCLFTVCSLTF